MLNECRAYDKLAVFSYCSTSWIIFKFLDQPFNLFIILCWHFTSPQVITKSLDSLSFFTFKCKKVAKSLPRRCVFSTTKLQRFAKLFYGLFEASSS